jgi:endonuclease G, mitochondrial
MARVEEAQAEPYYDEVADASGRESYYEGTGDADGEELRAALAGLLERTHDPRPSYRPMEWVYPRVDLHPDGLLRSLYSGATFSPQELIEADARVELARAEQFQEVQMQGLARETSEVEAQLAAIEAALPYNCEHVVPQSWFGEREPMRGDIHHLFACESGCNSFRGNYPYFDFTEEREIVRHACGRREELGFEPHGGKGPAARATLYFLLRYPGIVGDSERELPSRRLGLLVRWHEEDPVSEYELHRNWVTAELQGNRNPLIDHPDWARRIDFSDAWAMANP